MTEPVRSSATPTSDHAHEELEEEELEEYAGGYIKAHVGRIPLWLLVVYAVLFIWALYYLVNYWGGLGPGRPV
jgi:hypothetical protein